MQPAPAVAFIVDDGGTWRAARTALAMLVGAVLVAWALAWWPAAEGVGPALQLLLPAAVGAATGLFVWRRGRPESTTLRWSGQAWSLQTARRGGPAVPGRVDVMIDLGGWMLLRFRPDGCRADRWLALGSSAGAGARAALYAGPGAAAAPGAREAR